MEIVELEKPVGVIVQYGGQTPLKLARALEAAGAPIIGTSPDSIDWAEDRERFQKLVEQLGLLQPPNRTARTQEQALTLANEIGYPLVVRPSYVLGGRAMEVVYSDEDLSRYIREAVKVSNDSPVLLDRFLDHAVEVDVDIIADAEGNVLIGGIMEHIEEAGVHSGDSSCSLPPYTLSAEIQDRLRVQVTRMAQGAESHRPDEHPVRHPRRNHLRARSESTRLAHRAVRFESHRRALGQDCRALHGRAVIGVAECHP